MKTLPTLIVLMTVAAFGGCSRRSHPVPKSTSAGSNDSTESPSANATSPVDHEAPEFDPKLKLAWPGTPEESCRRVDAGTDREKTIYSADFKEHQPLTSYIATIYLITNEELRADDPKEWLPRHLSGDEVVELSRRQIEFGPHKYLGFEVYAQDTNLFVRRVNVLAGHRIYSVEVASTKRERLNAVDVKEFFESFAIRE